MAVRDAVPARGRMPETDGTPVLVDENGKKYVEPNPFVRASLTTEETFGDRSTQMVAGSSFQISDVEVPAFGFARGYLMLVEATGGTDTGADAVAEADAPWSVISDLSVTDTNGKQIIGPITGYDLYLLNKWLPSNGLCDPASSPNYTAVTVAGNFTFVLHIGHEIGVRDGLGALPNQNASSVYRISYTIAAPAAVFSTSPSGLLPSVRVRFLMESFAPVDGADARGVPNMAEPPASGTTMHVSKSVHALTSGENDIRFTRMGNLVRGLILVARNTDGDREDIFPDTIRIELDNKNLSVTLKKFLKERMWRRSAGRFTPDTGVLVLDQISDLDGTLGAEMRDQWLATTTATKYIARGSYSEAGTLHVLTQDVAPAGNVYS